MLGERLRLSILSRAASGSQAEASVFECNNKRQQDLIKIIDIFLKAEKKDSEIKEKSRESNKMSTLIKPPPPDESRSLMENTLELTHLSDIDPVSSRICLPRTSH
jgi:hypothetical protein